MLDVVDLNDVVVGSKTRGEVHRLQLPHRSVHVLVFNPDKDLLLQKRSMLKDECAGMWDSSCAGHVEAGQSYAETVAREFEEELGVALTADPDCSQRRVMGWSSPRCIAFAMMARLPTLKMKLMSFNGSAPHSWMRGW